MDLDILAESESDSESNHSNQDNVSVQRGAVTVATAGSDAGILWYHHKHCLLVSYPVIKMLTKVKNSCDSVISTLMTFICRVGISEDSGESSNQEEDYKSEGEQSNDGNDADNMNYIDEQLERCHTSGIKKHWVNLIGYL